MAKKKTDSIFYCADGKHAVRTLSGGRDKKGAPLVHRREVCEQCPWRKDSPIGAFPPDAYKHSATTAYDQAFNTFACHMSGDAKEPAVCAGFLLANSVNNLGVRMAIMYGRYDPRSVRRTVPLYKSYKAMAIANGVDKNDPVLRPCRSDTERWEPRHRSELSKQTMEHARLLGLRDDQS